MMENFDKHAMEIVVWTSLDVITDSDPNTAGDNPVDGSSLFGQ